MFTITLQEILDGLKVRFSRKSDSYVSFQQLQQGYDSLNTHYIKLNSIWEELYGYKPPLHHGCGGL